MDKSKIIRDAATVILIRDKDTNPKVLMGQRGANAAFMPNKFVFPGGAVDQADLHVPLAYDASQKCISRLELQASGSNTTALMVAAIRELWEESGQMLGAKGRWSELEPVPEGWQSFADRGLIPSAFGMSFVFRAITPKLRPRRFDARFFVVDATHLHSDPDDFSCASDELSHLQWIALDDVQQLDLPFITDVVLSEVTSNLPDLAVPKQVPFFNNTDDNCRFEYLEA